MPPAPLISPSARSKPFFHCAPYWALGPVSGPLTPIVTGSPVGSARPDGAPITSARIATPIAAARRVIGAAGFGMARLSCSIDEQRR